MAGFCAQASDQIQLPLRRPLELSPTERLGLDDCIVDILSVLVDVLLLVLRGHRQGVLYPPGMAAVDAPITIGELFPSDDIVARGVFAVTVVAQDLIDLGPMPSSEPAIGERETFRPVALQLRWARELIARLYEARWFIADTETHPDLKGFVESLREGSFGPLVPTNPFGRLWDVYLRPDEQRGSRSVAERLYATIRHTTAHYRRIDTPEAHADLERSAHSPARFLTLGGQSTYEWVYIVGTASTLANDGDEEPGAFVEAAELGADIAETWITFSLMALMQYTRSRRIAMGRLSTPWKSSAD